jgi:hypothetical protein
MNKQTNRKATALAAVGISILLIVIWSYYKNFILNEKVMQYYIVKNYPKINSNHIFYPNQTKDFYYDCSSNQPLARAERWVLYLTGTAYMNNPGYMKISIDDSNSKRFRTLAFSNYRTTYIIPFNKHSHVLPQKVRVRFEFTGDKSDPLFEMPLVKLTSEWSEPIRLMGFNNTIFPFSMKLHHVDKRCHPANLRIPRNS